MNELGAACLIMFCAFQ